MIQIPWDRRWVLALALIDIAGALYGFNWYKGQLGSTPVYTWPVVADSPLSTLLFGLYLLFLITWRRFYFLEALASFSMLKYGLWTVYVLGRYIITSGTLDFETFHLTLSHLGMALQALIFQVRYRPTAWWVLTVFGFSIFSDWADYTFGFHPAVPDPSALGVIASVTPALTVAVFMWCMFTPHSKTAQRALLRLHKIPGEHE